jgi:hypothetical protein
MLSRADLRIRAELLTIGEAGMALAKAKLAAAEQQRSDCLKATHDAERAAADAYETWSGCVGSNLLGPTALKAAGNRLLAAESGLVGARNKQEAADREAEERGIEFQAADASQRGQLNEFKGMKRRLGEKIAEQQQDQLTDLLLARRTQS